MKKTKLFHPYLADKTGKRGICTLKKTGTGVYLIYDATGNTSKVIYVGFASKDVKGVMYRHFQKWIDKRHPENKAMERIDRVSYFGKYFKNDDFKCKVIYCSTVTEALQLESALIKKYKPKDNKNKLNFIEMEEYHITMDRFNEADIYGDKVVFDVLPANFFQ